MYNPWRIILINNYEYFKMGFINIKHRTLTGATARCQVHN